MDNNTENLKDVSAKRAARIIARGEHSNHSHVLFGDVAFLEKCFQAERSPDYDKAVKLKAKADAKVKKIKASMFPAAPTYEEQIELYLDLPTKEKFELTQAIKAACKPTLEEYNAAVEKLDVATIRHIMETSYMATGASVWTEEHIHLPLKEGVKYKYVPQVEWHPYEDTIRQVQD